MCSTVSYCVVTHRQLRIVSYTSSATLHRPSACRQFVSRRQSQHAVGRSASLRTSSSVTRRRRRRHQSHRACSPCALPLLPARLDCRFIVTCTYLRRPNDLLSIRRWLSGAFRYCFAVTAASPILPRGCYDIPLGRSHPHGSSSSSSTVMPSTTHQEAGRRQATATVLLRWNLKPDPAGTALTGLTARDWTVSLYPVPNGRLSQRRWQCTDGLHCICIVYHELSPACRCHRHHHHTTPPPPPRSPVKKTTPPLLRAWCATRLPNLTPDRCHALPSTVTMLLSLNGAWLIRKSHKYQQRSTKWHTHTHVHAHRS